jgi:hypothetical protein
LDSVFPKVSKENQKTSIWRKKDERVLLWDIPWAKITVMLACQNFGDLQLPGWVHQAIDIWLEGHY